MLSYEFQIDQEHRIQEAREAVKEEANRQTDWQSGGEWDGFMGELPKKELWTELAYRDGYLTGVSRRFDREYGVEVEQVF